MPFRYCPHYPTFFLASPKKKVAKKKSDFFQIAPREKSSSTLLSKALFTGMALVSSSLSFTAIRRCNELSLWVSYVTHVNHIYGEEKVPSRAGRYRYNGQLNYENLKYTPYFVIVPIHLN